MTSTYRLRDAEVSHRQHPRTFSIPRSDKRRAVPIGAQVRLIFEPVEPVEGWGGERMWCTVEEKTPRGYIAVLENLPRHIPGLAPGDRIELEPRHIAALQLPDESPLPRLVGVGLDVLRNGAWPAWVTRLSPTSDDDSGWRVFSAAEATQERPRVRAISADALFRAWAVLDSVIEADAMGRWRWDEATLEYVGADRFPPQLTAAGEELGRIHEPAPPASMRAIATLRALDEPPSCAQRMAPAPGHEDDSGWSVFVGDEPGEYMEDASNLRAVPVARLLHLYPYLERVLGEQTEAVFVWDDDEGDWVKTDDPGGAED